jgi:hypothetical protein
VTRKWLADRLERRVATQRERTRRAHNNPARLDGQPEVPMCPLGRPQADELFMERGWTDRDGTRWVTCPCGMAHPQEGRAAPRLKVIEIQEGGA